MSTLSHFTSGIEISLHSQSVPDPSALSPTRYVPSASLMSGRTWWKPDILVFHLMRASPDRSTMLVLSRSVAAHGDVHMPVHRCVGLFSSPAAPVMRNSLAAGPYSFSSRFGLLSAIAASTGCSPPFSVCFHSSLKKSGGRPRLAPPARPPPAGAPAAGAAVCCANAEMDEIRNVNATRARRARDMGFLQAKSGVTQGAAEL